MRYQQAKPAPKDAKTGPPWRYLYLTAVLCRMATKRTTTPPPAAAPARPPYMLIEQIQVKGYKSLVDATLHVRPLTLLAGTNSSGKSSIMQPLLLIKQTMEAPYQPAGALVLDGVHVQAETAGELVSKVKSDLDKCYSLHVEGNNILDYRNVSAGYNFKAKISVLYKQDKDGFYIAEQRTQHGNFKESILTPNSWSLTDRVALNNEEPTSTTQVNGFMRLNLVNTNDYQSSGSIFYSFYLESSVARIMHIPGLRGAPQRSYLATFFQDQIKGTFDLYAAGTISQWQNENNTEALAQLNDSLQRLGLTNAVTAKVKNANEVELSVNRLPAASKAKPRKADMVNIADVGIGVSQVLPILVALIAAQEGQLVYVEQPELHLHPRAQVEMAHLLAAAARRGVRVIVETHSSLLLLTVQTLVAEGELTPDQVGLHWFARDAKGATTVTLTEVDEDGAYGEWPEDFGDIELTAQRNYLDAVTRRQPKRSAKA